MEESSHLVLMSPHPRPPSPKASENTGEEGLLLSTFMSLSRCPNILVPMREKTPSPCPRRQAASPSAGRKEGRLSQGDPGETTTTVVPGRSILARHFASRGKAAGWSRAQRRAGVRVQACRAGRGLLARTCPRQAEQLLGAHPLPPSPGPVSPARRRQGPPQGRGGLGKVM